MHEMILKVLISMYYQIVNILLILRKEAFCCYHRFHAATEPETGVFNSCLQPYAELTLYFGNQRVLGVVGLLVGKYLDVEHFLWSYCPTESHFFLRKAQNTKDSLVTEIKRQIYIKVGWYTHKKRLCLFQEPP